MSVVRRKNSRPIANLALLASGSILSLTMATQAQAQCVTSNGEPLNNITVDSTMVNCTGTLGAPIVVANADDVYVDVNGPLTTASGAIISVTGNNGTIVIDGGANVNGSVINMAGSGNQMLFGSAVTNGLDVTVGGADSAIVIGALAQVTQNPGRMGIFANPGESNTVEIRGGLYATGSNGQYLLRGGDGNQTVRISGFLGVQGDGLAIALYDGDDRIILESTANILGGTGNNILFNGGDGYDMLIVNGGGTLNVNSTEIERLTLNIGAGNVRVLNGTGEYELVVINGGDAATGNLAALGLTNSLVTVNTGASLQLNLGAAANFNNGLAGGGTLRQAGQTITYGGDGSAFTGQFDLLFGTAEIFSSNAFGTATILNNGVISFGAATLGNDISGNGSVVKHGVGLGILSGSNSYAGGTDITGGMLMLTNGAAAGTGAITIAGGATLRLDIAGDETLANDIAGAGNVLKTGAGTVTLTGTNSYSGGTTIAAGAIRVDDFARLGTGPVLADAGANLILNYNGAGQLLLTTPFLTGAGGFIKEGTGDVVMNQSSGYLGGTIIRAGRIGLNNGNALGNGTIQIDSGAELGIGGIALYNDITGSGLIRKTASNVAELYGDNSGFTGTIRVENGMLYATEGAALGSGILQIESGTSVQLDAAADSTVAAWLAGGGVFEKLGGGRVAMTGTNTHSGGTVVQGGTLAVTGNSGLGSGPVTIGSGAVLEYDNATASSFGNTLSGAGTFRKLGAGQLSFTGNFGIGALDLVAGRTRINSVATTNVSVGGNAVLDGTGRIVGTLTNNGTVAPGNSIGTLTVQGNYVHNGNSVLEIEFDGAGNIDLLDVTGNATINGGTLRFVSIGAAEGQGGTFLRTGGTLTGTFATVETVGAQLPLAVIYQPTAGLMAPSVLTARPSTFNAQSLAAADTALGFIDTLGVGEVRRGEGNRIWMSGFGAWGSRSAGGSTLAYDHNSRGISGGINFDLGSAVTLGAGIGWAKGDITLGSNGGGGDQSSVLGGVSARYSGNGFVFGAGLFYGKVDQDTLRNVSFSGFSDSVYGSTESRVFGATAEAGVPLGSAGGWAFSANARGSYVRQSQDGYTEEGTSPLRLRLDDIKTSTLEGQARLTAKASLWRPAGAEENMGEGLDLRVDVGGRYLGTLGDREIPVTFAVSNAGVVLQGDTRDAVQGVAGLGLDYATRGGATFSVGYRGEVGKTDRHAVSAGVSFAF
ncbi:autotransporter domain-containing protein [Sphingomonas canadensis]|uniref:Autotransporter domain-containing protein n=1 Tax=Sphingomonas canadensis TaxID=1219257 RepID=A0ABW3H4X1_9SPHN|nr:autotransporter domain-containing protein [Sphingomonas canadensis]MCW3834700.1 autotransporter domain-containing protein [Sphingomonas canadensis]